ncbi:MAG: hypothetical protein HRU25_14145 [Psychrobium sp.]|nr:hypothetical protein [Psychrobium sp.]
MSQRIDDVRQQIQQTRLDAQRQSQYLSTLMRHLDIAILVINEQGDIVQHNPTSALLLVP